MRPNTLICLAPFLAAGAIQVSMPAIGGDFSASVNISGKAVPADTGIRVYPGATVVPGKNDDSESASIKFAFGDYGLKVVAVKLKSNDSKDKIAAFYQSDLARFGAVVDCTAAEPGERSKRDRKSTEVTCDGDRAKRNGHVFKAGVKADQRVVSIEPKGDAIYISLVHVEVRGFD